MPNTPPTNDPKLTFNMECSSPTHGGHQHPTLPLQRTIRVAQKLAVKGVADRRINLWRTCARVVSNSNLEVGQTRSLPWFAVLTTLFALAGGGLAIWGSQTYHHTTIVVGLLAIVILSILPPIYATRLLVLVSVCTYFSIGLFGFHIHLDMLIVPAVLLSMVVHGTVDRFIHAFSHPVMKALSLFILANVLVSVFMSPAIKKSETICLWYTLDLVIVAMAIATYQQVGSGVLVADLYRAAKLAVAIGLGTYALNLLGVPVWGMSGVRARGIAFEPNILAGYAAMWTVILLTRRSLKTGDWLFILLSAVTFIVTSTRAAVLAVVIALMLASLGRSRIARVTVRGLLLGVVLLGVYLGLESIIGSNAHSVIAEFNRFRLSSSASDGRFSYWMEAIHDLNKSGGMHWLSGLGTDSFGFRHIDPTTIYQPSGPSGGYLSNFLLLAFYDAGVVGFLSLAYVARNLLRIPLERSNRWRYLAIILTFLIIAGATNPFFFSYYWLFIAVVLLHAYTPTRDQTLRKGQMAVMSFDQSDRRLILA